MIKNSQDFISILNGADEIKRLITPILRKTGLKDNFICESIGTSQANFHFLKKYGNWSKEHIKKILELISLDRVDKIVKTIYEEEKETGLKFQYESRQSNKERKESTGGTEKTRTTKTKEQRKEKKKDTEKNTESLSNNAKTKSIQNEDEEAERRMQEVFSQFEIKK